MNVSLKISVLSSKLHFSHVWFYFVKNANLILTELRDRCATRYTIVSLVNQYALFETVKRTESA